MIAVRWIGRILGVLLVGLFLLFMIGQGFNPLRLNGTEIPLASALFIALAGMLLVWRQELLGGTMVLAGMLAFYSINFAASGRLPGGSVFPLCFVPGILALVCWWKGRASGSASRG
jgi:hypothetical protein